MITYEADGKETTEQFDNVIIASGSRPVQKLSKEMEALGIPFSRVGDCVGIGKLDNAIHGGFMAAINI